MAASKRTPGMNQAEYDELYERLYEKKEDGSITDAELSKYLDKLDDLKNSGASKAEAEKALLGRAAAAHDPGARATDRAVTDLEKKFKKIYGAAATEMKTALQALEKSYAKRLADKRKDLAAGKITKEEFDKWVNRQILQQDIMKQKIDQCTGTLLHANEKALAATNGEQLTVFAENANFQQFQIDKHVGMNLMFSVYDETSAERLIRDNPDLLPRKKITDWRRS